MYGKSLIVILLLCLSLVACSTTQTEQEASEDTERASTQDERDASAYVERGAEMALVPAGAFMMGSEDGGSDESPVHDVYLNDFYIDIYEVTNARYDECVQDGACDPPCAFSSPPWCDNSWWRDNYNVDTDYADYPIIRVSWDDAQVYCEWREARLPTEAEWEKAARGTDGRIYPWGDEFDCKKGNFDDETHMNDFVVPGGEGCDGFEDTAPVGSFPAGVSPYGLYDMAGNVWEWVWDWYDKNYYANSADENPTGPSSGDYRVLRGGSWRDYPDLLRVANRYVDYFPGDLHFDIGFRCARSP